MKIILSIYLLVVCSFSFCQSDSEIESDSTSNVKPQPDTCYVVFSWNNGDINESEEADSGAIVYDTRYLDCSGESCRLSIQPECQLSNYIVRVYNRWGEILFESNNPGDVWCPYGNDEGVYIWQAEGTYPNGETFKRRGHVTLLNYPRSE